MSFTLHILTHGRFYTEEYDNEESALSAAFALEGEPRERAEQISEDGVVRFDRAALTQAFRARVP